MNTGIFLTANEQKEIKKLVKEAENDSWGLTVNEMFGKGYKTKLLLEAIQRCAIKHGLPDRKTYYGLARDFEILK
jgi:hypothetical protein